jgi:PAT family beta-lactamase induction signal transducer AmpG
MPSAYLTDTRWLRLASFTAFYFAQGVPIGLLSIAVPAWLAEHGMDLEGIAWYQGIVNLPWGFKLIAGPFMDRFAFPAMGRRRPWVIGAQLGLTLSIASLAVVTDAANHFALLTAIGFAVNLFASVQDVAVDGMAIDVLPETERGRANALMAFGQVAGFSSFAALSGTLLNAYGLPAAAFAATVAIGLVLLAITLVRERRGERLLPWTRGTAAHREHAVEASFAGIFTGLFRVLFLPMSVLLFVCELLVRVRDGIASSVVPVFAVQQLGFSSADYSQFQGYIGIPIALAGVAFGPLIDRFGIKRLYLLALLISGATMVGFAATQSLWPQTAYVVAISIVLGLTGQMVFVCYIALAMTLCWPRVAATQFAIYMSLSNLSRSIGAAGFAPFANQLGFRSTFLVIGGLMIAAAATLSFFDSDSHRRRLRALDEPPPERRIDAVAEAP